MNIKSILLRFTESKRIEDPSNCLAAQVNQAKIDWLLSLDYFNYVADPVLVDYCIYNILACEKKYCYLLRLAKKENIKGYDHILSW